MTDEEVEIRSNPDGSISVVFRGVLGSFVRPLAKVPHLVYEAWGVLPPVRKSRLIRALKATLYDQKRWMVDSLGVLDEEEAGPAVGAVGDVILEALGREGSDHFWSNAGFGANTSFLGRRLSRLIELIESSDDWTIRKTWHP